MRVYSQAQKEFILPDEVYNSIISEIDILNDAPNRFLAVVCEIELESDTKKKAEIAKQYIDSTGALKEIAYLDLGNCLRDVQNMNIQVARQLYLLERSISRRTKTAYTWLDRLRIFYKTYLLESTLHKQPLFNCPLRFISGHGKNRGKINHYALSYGEGYSEADMYFWKDDCMHLVEIKHAVTAIADELRKYAFAKARYNAEYVILYAEQAQKYYLLDYTNSNNPTANEVIFPLPPKF